MQRNHLETSGYGLTDVAIVRITNTRCFQQENPNCTAEIFAEEPKIQRVNHGSSSKRVRLLLSASFAYLSPCEIPDEIVGI